VFNWADLNFKGSNLIFPNPIKWNQGWNCNKIKVWGVNYGSDWWNSRLRIVLQRAREFRDSIRLKTRVKLKRLKVWRSIKNEIENIQDQRPNWKRCKTQRVTLKLGRGEIELILGIKTQLRTWLNKSKG
jgi:murein L,D-transpeptidase YafK